MIAFPSEEGYFILLKTTIHTQDSNRWRGLRVGLFGGSFNPPHEGHLAISRAALRILKLDAVWWMVSPRNPLKSAGIYSLLSERLELCSNLLLSDPRMLATDIEDQLGTFRSYDTIIALRSCFPATDFVFLMGTDSAQNFHHWYRWQEITDRIALAVLERPPAGLLSRGSPLKRHGRITHKHLSRAENVPLVPSTCYWLHQHALDFHSSTELRKLV